MRLLRAGQRSAPPLTCGVRPAVSYQFAVFFYALTLGYIVFGVLTADLQPPPETFAIVLLLSGPLILVIRRWHGARRRGDLLMPHEYLNTRRLGRYAGVALLWAGHLPVLAGVIFLWVGLMGWGVGTVVPAIGMAGIMSLLLYALAVLTIEISIRRWQASGKA